MQIPKIWILALFLISSIAFGQDVRLLDIKTIYIVPNGDEKETRQFEEKIPKQLGWIVTNKRSDADALLVYRQGPSGATVFDIDPYGFGRPENLPLFDCLRQRLLILNQ